MCRLYGLHANEPTKVECSLVLAQNALLTQSQTDLRGKSHADGWGIAYYEDGEPTVDRRETAAFETPHFSAVAERVFARTVLAHVRRATVSGSSLANTHPFVHGPWTFAHNGTVRAFERVAPHLERELPPALQELRRGSTDSELAFYFLLARLARAGVALDRARAIDLEKLAGLMAGTVREIAALSEREGAERPAELNFILTDGHVLVATRWHNSLYWTARDGVHDCEVCGIPHIHHDPHIRYRAAVVVSEPISHEDWREVPQGAALAVDAGGRGGVIEV